MGIVRQLAGRIMPGACLLCGAEPGPAGGLCRACEADLPPAVAACPVCAAAQPGRNLCGNCQKRRPPFQRTLCAYRYEYPVDRLIPAFKYRRSLAVAGCLTPRLIHCVRAQCDSLPEALLPVPLHWRRLYRRGFNQSLVIARALSADLAIGVDPHLLRRVRATREQARLTPKQRRRNLKGAFTLKRACEYESVAIVDDVVTTGATVTELARLLRRHGVKEIQVWALARTQSEG